MAREGQTRVEIRPGAFVWMDENGRKAHEAWVAGQQPAVPDTADKVRPFTPTGIESAAIEAPERAVQSTPKRKG